MDGMETRQSKTARAVVQDTSSPRDPRWTRRECGFPLRGGLRVKAGRSRGGGRAVRRHLRPRTLDLFATAREEEGPTRLDVGGPFTALGGAANPRVSVLREEPPRTSGPRGVARALDNPRPGLAAASLGEPVGAARSGAGCKGVHRLGRPARFERPGGPPSSTGAGRSLPGRGAPRGLGRAGGGGPPYLRLPLPLLDRADASQKRRTLRLASPADLALLKARDTCLDAHAGRLRLRHKVADLRLALPR